MESDSYYAPPLYTVELPALVSIGDLAIGVALSQPLDLGALQSASSVRVVSDVHVDLASLETVQSLSLAGRCEGGTLTFDALSLSTAAEVSVQCLGSADLASLAALAHVSRLSVGDSVSLRSLVGLEGLLGGAEYVSLWYLPALDDVSALSGLSSIGELEISRCPSLCRSELQGLVGGLTQPPGSLSVSGIDDGC